jgi:hypothetical protein
MLDPCREFDAFAGVWFDAKGQTVLISAWGVIRYPTNAKLRFEAKFIGPNVMSVTFDKDPLRRTFVGTLNHLCEMLAWSNGTQWTRKGSKSVPHEFEFVADGRCSLASKTATIEITRNKKRNRRHNDSCLVM